VAGGCLSSLLWGLNVDPRGGGSRIPRCCSGQSWDARAAALEGGSFLVCGRASISSDGRCHGREGDVVFGELGVVAVARMSSWRRPAPCVGGDVVMPGGNPCPTLGRGVGVGVCGRRPLPEGAVAGTLILRRASGENLRSSDRAVTALLCRVLLEDIALKRTASGFPLVVWRMLVILGWRWLFAWLSSARLASCPSSSWSYPGVACWCVNDGGRCTVGVGR
jgi:hypothetical protein